MYTSILSYTILTCIFFLFLIIVKNCNSQDLVKQFLMRAQTLQEMQEKIANQSDIIEKLGRRMVELENYIDQLEANKTGICFLIKR